MSERAQAPRPTPRFGPGQIVTVFRSRLRPEHSGEYAVREPEIMALAKGMPGLIDVKDFAADDGERVTLVTFEDAETHRAWRDHPEHRAAQREGRDRFYAEYSIQVSECTRAREFTAGAE
jgi:heme-degrading monooxygenase HmoA